MNHINENTCKVPYGINDQKRYEIDNLPYHFTIFATNKENQEQLLKIAKTINIDKIKLKINDIKIMKAIDNSYCLYLSIEENEPIRELQKIFYKEFPKEKYNPEKNNMFFATTKAKYCYTDIDFSNFEEVFVMFGKETKGLPEDILQKYINSTIRIPMIGDLRSLNLSNSVAIIAYEILRQGNFKGLKQISEYFE